MIGGAFAPALAILKVHVEHVDLVVFTDLSAIGPEQEAAIGNLAVGERDRRRAHMQIDGEFAGKAGSLPNDDIVRLVPQYAPQA